jgi:hypothetical protein
MQANDDMTTNETKIKNLLLPLITAEVKTAPKKRQSRKRYTSSKAKENLLLRLKQKRREVQQLGINPDDLLEEEEKRQLFVRKNKEKIRWP